jgi:hypothetical protein
MKGQMAAGGPYFMPGLDESYEKKAPKEMAGLIAARPGWWAASNPGFVCAQ